MNLLFKIILIFLFFLSSDESKANTLLDSLNSAYLNNPVLNAERAKMRAAKEEKRESVSEFLPSVTISGYRSEQDNSKGNLADTHLKPKENSMLIEQKIFQGGSGVANFVKKKHGQSLGEFELKKTEQEILLEAAKAHSNLLLNKKKVNINLINIDLLERQVETEQNRLETGEISLTDLAQSESSLAGARAQLISAQNDLVTSKANFEKVIGKKATENIQEIKSVNLNLPESLASAYNIEEIVILTWTYDQSERLHSYELLANAFALNN